MDEVVKTRLRKEEIEELRKISEQERIERSALKRKFLLIKMKEYRMKEAREKKRKGIVSLAEGATLAKISLYEMMEYVQRENIHPPPLSEQEMNEEFDNDKNTIQKMKKDKT